MPNTPLSNTSIGDSCFEAVVEQFLREREAGSKPDQQRYVDHVISSRGVGVGG